MKWTIRNYCLEFVIRSCTSKDNDTIPKETNEKMTNSDLQNTTQILNKTKICTDLHGLIFASQ
jgi:hypothetical protein